MTREEIIKGLENYIPWADEYEVDIEVLTGALELLKKEPSGDLISRNAVLKEISCWIGSGEYRYAMSERFLIDRLIDLPSVNPQEIVRDCTSCRWSKDGCCAGTEECHLCMWESQYKPKTGHWIRITNGAMKEKYICSECGRQIEDDGIEGLLSIKYPYCHCGCRMVEPQESEVLDADSN